VIASSIDLKSNIYESGTTGEMGESYHCTFTAIKSADQFRPARVTPKPLVPGLQTAVVTGPKGEEIYTDKYGRIKVQFHWDREGKHDENTTCFMRVATPWAGQGWGAISLPRIGQEVVVAFLEGDPDQPLVVGSVYNGKQMPPYTLPDEKTKSTLQSRSTKDGSKTNFNEIRFEDKKDSEQVFVNAEKDMDLRVENDSREFIGKDRHLIVKANQTELVEGNKHARVKGDHVEKIDSSMSLSVGSTRNEKIGTVDTIEAGREIHLTAGMKVIVEAGTQISLKVGGNFVDISPAGVTIVGTMVLINSGGSPGSGTDSTPDSPKDPDVADDGTKTGKLN
jgi:type VI secretion system secreted protein VgrG